MKWVKLFQTENEQVLAKTDSNYVEPWLSCVKNDDPESVSFNFQYLSTFQYNSTRPAAQNRFNCALFLHGVYNRGNMVFLTPSGGTPTGPWVVTASTYDIGSSTDYCDAQLVRVGSSETANVSARYYDNGQVTNYGSDSASSNIDFGVLFQEVK